MTVQEWLGTENQLGQDIWEEECFLIKTKEHPCYYINDDYTFKEDVPFFGFKKGTDSKEVFKWQNI